MILLTGVTGFLGRELLPEIITKFGKVRCLLREKNKASLINYPDIEFIFGDMDRLEIIEDALSENDKLINLIPFVSGYIPYIVSTCERMGIKRAVFIGSTQVFSYQDNHIRKLILEAEESIITSSLDYTIIRPTMIYGNSHDRNMSRLIRFIERFPVIPVPGSGTKLQKPVFVQDVVNAIIAVLDSPKTIREVYNLPGRNALSLNQIIDIITSLLGVKRVKIHLPVSIIALMVSIVKRLKPRFPLSPAQFIRLQEDKDFDYKKANDDFGYDPTKFEHGIKKEINELICM